MPHLPASAAAPPGPGVRGGGRAGRSRGDRDLTSLDLAGGDLTGLYLAGGGPAVLERRAQLGPAAVDPAAHRTQLDAEGGRDLLVGEALDIAEHDGGAVLR